MARTVLITGGNLGDRPRNLQTAREMVGRRIGPVVAVSKVHESPAWGFESEENFLNQVVVADTRLEPMELLAAVHDIEALFGRDKRRQAEYGADGGRIYRSRAMDIDILYYDDLHLDTHLLTIPHPAIALREFVLRPLEDVKMSLGDKISAAHKKTLSL